MPKRRQPNRIVHTASGRNLRSEELRRKIRDLLEDFPRLSNEEIATRVGVSRTTAGKYAAETRRAQKPDRDLRRKIKMFWNADATDPAEIAKWLEEHYGFQDIGSDKVRRILEELRQDGEIHNEYANSPKIVFDHGEKREIKKDLDVNIYSQMWQAWRHEARENARKREIRKRYAGSTPNAKRNAAAKASRSDPKAD